MKSERIGEMAKPIERSVPEKVGRSKREVTRETTSALRQGNSGKLGKEARLKKVSD